MSTFKTFQNSVLTLAFGFFLSLGFYNAMVVNSDSFMHEVSDIKFVKRLDEIHGRVEFGRMAASSIEWKKLNETKEIPTKQVVAKNQIIKAKHKVVNQAQTKLPPPAISQDLDMVVSNVFFKGPMDATKVSGGAKLVDGMIEEINVVLPDGQLIEIQTRERMVGNVFQYEDTETRELKSGMFYEVKKGTYMITLTNDSNFPGLRVELKTDESNEVAYNEQFYENVNFNSENIEVENDVQKVEL